MRASELVCEGVQKSVEWWYGLDGGDSRKIGEFGGARKGPVPSFVQNLGHRKRAQEYLLRPCL